MNQKNNTYVDVTQLIHWQGFVAGIPRVMYELSRRFSSDENTNVVYVSWVKEVGYYCEVDFFDTMNRRNGQGGIGYVYAGQNTSTKAEGIDDAPRMGLLHRVKQLGK